LAQRDFLKRVFDWNYFAAADCIAEFREDDPEPRQLSLSIRAAILAAVGEKRFDPIERTRRRANEILQHHRYEIAQPYREGPTRETLVHHIATLGGSEAWFTQWRGVFSKDVGDRLDAKEVEPIASDDSLIGWAAANAARRTKLDEEQQQRVRSLYEDAAGRELSKSVRWRVVHVLGAYPNADNASLLLKAVREDPYHWTQYGAARALVEVASQSEEGLRGPVVQGLCEFIDGYNPNKLWMRRQILREIVEAAFTATPQSGWKHAAMKLFERILLRAVDESDKRGLQRRASEFQSYIQSQ
jgi:hypothetical protein